MRGRVSGIALVIGLAAVLAGLFAIGLWPKWNALKVAQAEAAKDDLQAVVYVTAKRGSPEGRHRVARQPVCNAGSDHLCADQRLSQALAW